MMNERRPEIMQLMRWFEFDHLPHGLSREVSEDCNEFMHQILDQIRHDTPELTAGLRKLLEAKDCFVRAAIAAHEHVGVDHTKGDT